MESWSKARLEKSDCAKARTSVCERALVVRESRSVHGLEPSSYRDLVASTDHPWENMAVCRQQHQRPRNGRVTAAFPSGGASSGRDAGLRHPMPVVAEEQPVMSGRE